MAELPKVQVILRQNSGDRSWLVEVSPHVTLPELLPYLIASLDLPGQAEDYDLTNVGSLSEPVLQLRRSTPVIGAVIETTQDRGHD